MMLTERNKQKLSSYIEREIIPIARSIANPEIIRSENKNFLDSQEIKFVHWSPYKGSIGIGKGLVFLKFNKKVLKDYFNFYRRQVARQSFLEFNVAQELLDYLFQIMIPYGFHLFNVREKTLYSYLLYGVNGVKRGQFFNKALHKKLLAYKAKPVSEILQESTINLLLHNIQATGLVNEHTLNFRSKLKNYVLNKQDSKGCLQIEDDNEDLNSVDGNEMSS